jgi:hypothetical protein
VLDCSVSFDEVVGFMRPNMILDWQFLLSSELRMAFLSDARLERGCSILFDVRQISVMHAG